MASLDLHWAMPPVDLMRQTFSLELVDAIRKTQVDRCEISFWKVFLWEIEEIIDVFAVAKDRKDFLKLLEKVISPVAKEQIIQNTILFDSLTEQGLSDIFITHCTMKQWLFLLCEALIKDSLNSRRTNISSESSAGIPVFSQGGSVSSTSIPLTPQISKGIPQLDDPPGFWGEVQPSNRIVQVSLEGPDLIRAWQENQTIVDARRRATLSRLDEPSLEMNQAPAAANSTTYTGGQFVFHGTSAHLSSYSGWTNQWYETSVDIRGADTEAQMNPPGVSAVYTAFSSFRCFLWAAFKGTLYNKIPSHANINFMNRKWVSKGNTFQGVAVLVFEPPASGKACTSFTLPANKGALFEEQVSTMRASKAKSSPRNAWKELRSVHESDTTEWPDVLHCAEHGQQRQALRGFQINLWRSVWAGDGIDVLNDSYLFTIAISFQKRDPVPPAISSQDGPSRQSPKKDDDSDNEGQGKEREKKATFGRKLGKRMSAIFRKEKKTA